MYGDAPRETNGHTNLKMMVKQVAGGGGRRRMGRRRDTKGGGGGGGETQREKKGIYIKELFEFLALHCYSFQIALYLLLIFFSQCRF